MPRVNMEYPAGLPPVEPAGGLLEIISDSGRSFDEHLQQARQTTTGRETTQPDRTDTDRPREPEDTRPVDGPVDTKVDPAETPPGDETQTGENQTEETAGGETETGRTEDQPKTEEETEDADVQEGAAAVRAELTEAVLGESDENQQPARKVTVKAEAQTKAEAVAKENAIDTSAGERPGEAESAEATHQQAKSNQNGPAAELDEIQGQQNGDSPQETAAALTSQQVEANQGKPAGRTTGKKGGPAADRVGTQQKTQETATGVQDATPIVNSEDAAVELLAAPRNETTLDKSETKPDENTPKPLSGSTDQADPGAADRTAAGRAARSEATGKGQDDSGPDQAGRVRFVQRVTRAFEALAGRGGSIRIRLHPPELGSIRLDITVRNGALSARLETDTPGSRNLLLDNLPVLRDRLAQLDIKVERFDVDYTGGSSGGSPEGPDDRPQSENHAGRQPSQPDEAGETKKAAREPRVATPPGQGTQLNVVV